MKRIGLAALLGAGVALASPGCSDSGTTTAPVSDRPARPNIVLIVLDDSGYDDFGTDAPSAVPTPALDALARDGTRFSASYASSPVCSPTRAALLTGLHPARLGLRRGVAGRSRRGIPPDVVTLPELLRREGYATALVGKWHLGFTNPAARPEAQGFDHSVMRAKDPATYAGGTYFDPALEIDGVNGPPQRGHQTEIFTDHAIRFVREHRDEPFFLTLWYKAPHEPIEPPPDWARRFPDTPAGRYAALVAFADHQIGRLLGVLDELGLANRTLVIATSDNGAVSTGTELRGGKAQVFEGGIRVPLVMRWPARVPAGARNDSLVVSADLLPTLAEALGIDVAGMDLDGESFWNAVETGERRARSAPLVWEVREYVAAEALPEDSLNSWAVRWGDDKLVYAGRVAQLFDLAADPAESHDLSRERSEVRLRLERAYRSWRAEASRIEPRVAAVEGATGVDGGWDFSRGGTVRLEPHALFDFNDGDFTFAARLRLDAEAPPAPGTIARREGSWALRLSPEGRLELVVERERGGTLVLEGGTIEAGVDHDVAFTALALRASGSVIRLYVDGKLAAGSMDLHAVRSTPSPIELGGDPAFAGTLRELRLYAASLAPAELLAR